MIDVIDTYFFAEVNPIPYVALRIMVGVLLFLTALDFVVSYDICSPVEEGGFYNSRHFACWRNPTIFRIFNCPFWLYLTLYFICSICIIIGFFSIVFFCLIFYLIISKRAFMNEIHCGSDQILQYFCLWMIFSSPDAMFSVTSLIIQDDYLIPNAYAGRCMTINFSMFYCLSVLAKLQGKDWTSGVAVWNAMNFPDRHCWGWPAKYLQNKFLLSRMMTYYVLFVEGLAPVGFVIKPLMPIWAIMLCMMHLGIEVTMFVGMFGWMMIVFLVFLFLTYLYW